MIIIIIIIIIIVISLDAQIPWNFQMCITRVKILQSTKAMKWMECEWKVTTKSKVSNFPLLWCPNNEVFGLIVV